MNTLSRRELLKLLGLSAAGAVLAFEAVRQRRLSQVAGQRSKP